jgi:signal transduction histidine kinase
LTLTRRLSLFFLGLLAVVLVGFSVTLYILARNYLHGQIEDRLHAATDTLAGAVEVGPEGVEWEPAERPQPLRSLERGGEINWLIHDERGRVVDSSAAQGKEELLTRAAEQMEREVKTTVRLEGPGGRWLISQRWVRGPAELLTTGAPRRGKFTALAIVVGAPLHPVRQTLWLLAGSLAGVSVAIWLAALVLGRIICRLALRPITRMATSARVMDASDLGRRLPVPGLGDELDDLSRSFNGLLDRLQESFERQRRFTGDASHQLRTPLTALLGQIEVALRRDRAAGEYRTTLAAVQQQALHLQRIIEALLFLARADAEARLPELEPVDLVPWMEHYVRTWSSHPRVDDLRLEYPSGASPVAAVHSGLLGELVTILVENACKYSQPGSPITIRLGREGAKAVLSVEDQGSGISDGELPQVFEPFFRSADARRRGVHGVGLGLAIARRLAEGFGATLTATSKAGMGSRFTLAFPEQCAPPGASTEG